MTPTDDTTAKPIPAPAPRRRRRRLAVVLGVLVPIAAVGLWAFRGPTATPRGTIAEDDYPIRFAFAPDGRHLAIGKKGVILAEIPGRGGPTREAELPGSADLLEEGPWPNSPPPSGTMPSRAWPVAFSPDGKIVVASNRGDESQYPIGAPLLRVWDVATRKLKATLALPAGSFVPFVVADQFTFAEGGRVFQASTRPGRDELRVLRWDAKTWEPLPDVVVPDAAGQLEEFVDHGSAIAFARPDRSMVVHDMATGRPRATLVAPQAKKSERDDLFVLEIPHPLSSPHDTASSSPGFLSVRFSPDGRTMTSISADETLQIWDVPSAKIRGELTPRTLSSRFGLPWEGVTFAPDGKTAVIGFGDHSVEVWDVAGAKSVATIAGFPLGDPPRVAFAPDGRTFALADPDLSPPGRMARFGRLVEWNLDRIGLGGLATPFLRSDVPHGRVRFFDARTGRPTGQLTGVAFEARQIAFSPDGRLLAITGVFLKSMNSISGYKTMLWDVP